MNAYLEKLKLQGLHYERLLLQSSTLQGSPTKFHQMKMKSLKHCNDIMSQSICFAQFSALAQKVKVKNSRHDICTKKAHNCIQTFTIHSWNHSIQYIDSIKSLWTKRWDQRIEAPVLKTFMGANLILILFIFNNFIPQILVSGVHKNFTRESRQSWQRPYMNMHSITM